MSRVDESCIERWPDCEDGRYDPRCCRWPKSCIPTLIDIRADDDGLVYGEVLESDLIVALEKPISGCPFGCDDRAESAEFWEERWREAVEQRDAYHFEREQWKAECERLRIQLTEMASQWHMNRGLW
jgi:hypothetical protein